MEGANTNTAVLQTMGEAAKALKKAHADMDVDQVMKKYLPRNDVYLCELVLGAIQIISVTIPL